MEMSELDDMTLGDDDMVQKPQPSRSRLTGGGRSQKISGGSKAQRVSQVGAGAVDLGRKVKIENAFFKINYYWGEALGHEIEKVIPELTEKFKTKDDGDDMMDSAISGMGDLAGMVRFAVILVF